MDDKSTRGQNRGRAQPGDGPPKPATPPRFNIDTMSGVFPGTRTARFQRLRLAQDDAGAEDAQWLRVLWYDSPRSCALLLLTPSGDEQLVARLEEPEPKRLHWLLDDALTAVALHPHACGLCQYWRPLTRLNDDGLPLGACTYAPDTVDAWAEALRHQSALALECPHFSRQRAHPATAAAAAPAPEMPLRRSAEVRKEQERQSATLRGRLRRLFTRETERTGATSAGADELLERSGVGAGTEPCFACQGRIANLGALTTASPEGDKQTYSVWRCRNCFTTYLNRWIDRWERLETLETDERYWRVAPAEAAALLTLIRGVTGGDHPAGRHEREAERDRLEAFVAERPPLSHQIKLGR